MAQLFVGLGPKGSTVSEQQLSELLGQFAPVVSVVCRGSYAFVDVKTVADAQQLISSANGQYIGDVRLFVRESRPQGAVQPERHGNSVRGEHRGVPAVRHGGPVTLVIGLGPQGGSVSEDALRARLGEVAPVLAIRRGRDERAFADVASASDADRVISQLHGATLGACRLSVQVDVKRARESGAGFDDRRRGGRGRHY